MSHTAGDVVRAAIANSVERFANHEVSIAEGDDPEDIHQARVAARRLRSDLRTFHAFVDSEWSGSLRSELRWLGAELGAVRDTEVMLDRLRRHSDSLPDGEHAAVDVVLRRLVADWKRARQELKTAMLTERYHDLRERLDAAATNPKLGADADGPAKPLLRPVVRKPWRKLKRAVGALSAQPPDEALHEVRIRAKRCRYACEATEDVFGKATRRFARAVADVQDILGEHQDAVVARAWLSKTAEQCGANEAFAAGMLARVEAQAAEAARDAFPRAWKRVEARVPKWL
jgi:CHAD domain-containing protein